MTSLRLLTKKELDFLLKDVKNEKQELAYFLKNKIRVYSLTQSEIKRIKIIIDKVTSEKNLPRYLKEDELNEIVSVIPAPPSCISEVSEFNKKVIRESLKNQLMIHKISPKKENIQKLKDRIYETFLRSLCHPGESVGSNGANSIGQLLTQINLNTFHSSGSAESSDLSSVEELFNISAERKQDTCTVHFRNKNLTKEEIFKSYNQKLKGINLKDIVIDTEIFHRLPEKDEVWYNNYEKIKNIKIPRSMSFLRIKLNKYKCFLYDISAPDVISIIQKTTRNDGKNTVTCVPTSTPEGIIDIHVDEVFIVKIVNEFITKGKSFKDCKNRKFSIKKGTNSLSTLKEKIGKEREKGERKKILEESIAKEDYSSVTSSFIKGSLSSSENIKDLIDIFLDEILVTCFGEMKLIGIKGLENTNTITINMMNFLNFTRFQDLEKVKSDGRFYNAYVDYNVINILGVPEEKIINFIESCGIKIVENNLSGPSPNCIVFLPDFPEEKFEGKMRYKKTKNNSIFDLKENKEINTLEEPLELMGRKLKESEEEIRRNIKTMILDEGINGFENFQFPEIYRNGYYNYIKAYGSNIFTRLISNKLVDPRFSMSDNVNDINKYYGIEASRLFLIREYSSNDSIRKMNHVNIDLLVDFQTTMGHLTSVSSTDIAKYSNSALSVSAFEQPMLAFQKASTIGTKDVINNISSCLMTGKKFKNGTGIVEIDFEDSYLKDDENKIREIETKQIGLKDVKQSEIEGGCFGSGKYVQDSAMKQEDNPLKDILEEETTDDEEIFGSTDDEEIDLDLDLNLEGADDEDFFDI